MAQALAHDVLDDPRPLVGGGVADEDLARGLGVLDDEHRHPNPGSLDRRA